MTRKRQRTEHQTPAEVAALYLAADEARWLGEHYRARGLDFDRVIVGDMQRHKETLQGIGADRTGIVGHGLKLLLLDQRVPPGRDAGVTGA